jgi:hypothetical protein
MIEIIDWKSAVSLLATLIRQVYKQRQEGTGEGVSNWLFVGQVLPSTGFTVYGCLVGNRFFR